MGYTGPYSLRARCASEVVATLIGVFLGNGCIANTQLSRTKVRRPPSLPTPNLLHSYRQGDGPTAAGLRRATVSRSGGSRSAMAFHSVSAYRSWGPSVRTSTQPHAWRCGSQVWVVAVRRQLQTPMDLYPLPVALCSRTVAPRTVAALLHVFEQKIVRIGADYDGP